MEDALIPQAVRETLGLQTTHDVERRKEHIFETLVRGARHVTMFYAEGHGQLRSRWIDRSLWERWGPAMTDAGDTTSVSYRLSLANSLPAPVPKSKAVAVRLRGFAFSASALDTYLRCPLQFYYRFILRLGEKEDAGAELEAPEIGRFVHDCLREFFAPRVGHPLNPDELKGADMEEVVGREFRSLTGTIAMGSLALVARQVRLHLGQFVTEYQIPRARRETITIEGLEQKYAVTKFGFRFEGRIDRVERRNGTVTILDYKTGKDSAAYAIRFKLLNPDDRSTWHTSIGSVQLPFYTLLYSTHHGVPPKTVHAAYLHLGRNKITEEIEEGVDEDGLNGHHEILENLLRRLVEEIADGGTPFSPPPDPRKACPGCPFQSMCGTQWIKGWR